MHSASTLVVHHPAAPLPVTKPVALTIGTFDGVHSGHRAVLQRVAEEAERRATEAAVVTYDNHPSEVLHATRPTPLLCTLDHKLALLQEVIPLRYLLLFHFDRRFAAQSAENFLQQLMEILPFSYLNMGYDGRIGRHREGDSAVLEALSQQMGFALEYMPPYRLGDTEVSSSRIRHLVQSGELEEASHLLGRPYSIVGKTVRGAGLSVEGLALPPPGVYAVEVQWRGRRCKGIARLGNAAFLEIHLLDDDNDLDDTTLEVFFSSYTQKV